MQAEERATGSIGVRMYLQYLAAWSPFFLVPAATFGIAAGERVLSVRRAVQDQGQDLKGPFSLSACRRKAS